MKNKDQVRQDKDKLHNLLGDTEVTFRLYNKDGTESKLKLCWSSFSISEKREPKPKVNPDFHDYIDLEFVLRKE